MHGADEYANRSGHGLLGIEGPLGRAVRGASYSLRRPVIGRSVHVLSRELQLSIFTSGVYAIGFVLQYVGINRILI